VQGIARDRAVARNTGTYVIGHALRACVWAGAHAFRAGQGPVPKGDGDGNAKIYQVIS
jgi:hypothetical protein